MSSDYAIGGYTRPRVGPLVWTVVRHGTVEELRHAIGQGANVLLPGGPQQTSPLHEAVRKENLVMIQMLVYAYADVDAVDVNGLDPHDYAQVINLHQKNIPLMSLMSHMHGVQKNMRRSREFRRVRNLHKNYDMFSLGVKEKETNKSLVKMFPPETIRHIKQFLGD